MAQTTK